MDLTQFRDWILHYFSSSWFASARIRDASSYSFAEPINDLRAKLDPTSQIIGLVLSQMSDEMGTKSEKLRRSV
jgi:hypothetical protein